MLLVFKYSPQFNGFLQENANENNTNKNECLVKGCL